MSLYYYKKASNKNYPLAEFNLGQLIERTEGIEEAINYYVSASKHEKEKFIYHKYEVNDELINLSLSFIILLTNLKLIHYYINKEKEEKAEEYIIKIYNQIMNPSDDKKLIILNEHNIITKIRKLFIISTFSKKNNINSLKKSDIIISNSHQIDNKIILFDSIQRPIKDQNQKNKCKEIQFSHENKTNLKLFLDEISKIIDLMESTLYKAPYYILFGRYQTTLKDKTRKEQTNSNITQINHEFYEGFDLCI